MKMFNLSANGRASGAGILPAIFDCRRLQRNRRRDAGATRPRQFRIIRKARSAAESWVTIPLEVTTIAYPQATCGTTRSCM
jgi:hypothetical protein